VSARNLGRTIRERLAGVGIVTVADIARVGPGSIYRLLSAREPDRRLPVCYYLYSLQGAIDGRDWRTLSDEEKSALRRSAGLE
jgi:DNA transformation protein